MSGWIHHIDITVSDLTASTRYYDLVLPRMGFRRIADVAEGPLWAGARVELGLQSARPERARSHDRYTPGLHHLAFGAADRAAVDRLYQALLELRIDVLDPPAPYDRYTVGYYAVFFVDPDGIKLEYVHTPKWPGEP